MLQTLQAENGSRTRTPNAKEELPCILLLSARFMMLCIACLEHSQYRYNRMRF
jgi:hypothetical protein